MKFEAGNSRVTALLRDDLGMLGFFESDDHEANARDVLHRAAAWLREQGATRVVGPMDGDTWHRYRVNVGPFDVPPFLLEPVNPPYWQRLWESAGFVVAESYCSKRIDDVTEFASRLANIYERSLAHGYTFRPLDKSRLRDELGIVYEISLEIFKENAFYADIDRESFLKLYDGVDRLMVPGLVLFAVAPDGTPCGFIFAYPDSATDAVNYKTLGVTNAHRRGGVAVALQHLAYKNALALGRRIANHCLMRDENVSARMDAGEGYVFRRYLLYTACHPERSEGPGRTEGEQAAPPTPPVPSRRSG